MLAKKLYELGGRRARKRAWKISFMTMLLNRYKHVFEGRQVTLPKPFAAEPIELKFVEDPVPQSVPEPR
jgi:hypothetical protein